MAHLDLPLKRTVSVVSLSAILRLFRILLLNHFSHLDFPLHNRSLNLHTSVAVMHLHSDGINKPKDDLASFILID